MSTPPPLDEMLCFAMYTAAIAINRAYKPALDRLGITYPQFLVLQALQEEEDGRTVGAIGERLMLDSSTITPLVKRMEAAGLVRRTRNPDDERQVRVHLTERGAALWADSGCLAEVMAERSRLDPDALATFNRQVRELHRVMAAHAG